MLARSRASLSATLLAAAVSSRLHLIQEGPARDAAAAAGLHCGGRSAGYVQAKATNRKTRLTHVCAPLGSPPCQIERLLEARKFHRGADVMSIRPRVTPAKAGVVASTDGGACELLFSPSWVSPANVTEFLFGRYARRLYGRCHRRLEPHVSPASAAPRRQPCPVRALLFAGQLASRVYIPHPLQAPAIAARQGALPHTQSRGRRSPHGSFGPPQAGLVGAARPPPASRGSGSLAEVSKQLLYYGVVTSTVTTGQDPREDSNLMCVSFSYLEVGFRLSEAAAATSCSNDWTT
ncbi:hypothetical protein GQ53DRAFT_99639 [Thozetella sp. PMI_491]|nr:hypothetical protein GQ53DRAFT_99639 [Thozetella sp. PMI_491]